MTTNMYSKLNSIYLHFFKTQTTPVDTEWIEPHEKSQLMFDLHLNKIQS